MATNTKPRIGEVRKLNGRTVVWSGDDYKWQSVGSHKKLAESGEFKIGGRELNRVGRAVAPVTNAVANFQKKFREATPWFEPVGKLIDKAMLADDKLPSSVIARGGAQLAQAAGDKANLDPRLSMALPILLGGVRVGDDSVRAARMAQRKLVGRPASELPPIVDRPGARGFTPPRNDITPGTPGPRQRRQLPPDSQARAGAQRAAGLGDPLANGRAAAGTDSPNQYKHWQSGDQLPGRDIGVVRPQQGPLKPTPGNQQLSLRNVDPRFGEDLRGTQQNFYLNPDGKRGPKIEFKFNNEQESQLARRQGRINQRDAEFRAAGGYVGPAPGSVPRSRRPNVEVGEPGGRNRGPAPVGRDLSASDRNPWAGRPIGGTPPSKREARRLQRFQQYDLNNWEFSYDPIARARRGTEQTFPSRVGKDIGDPRYVDANRADAFYAQGDDNFGRYNDDGGFTSSGNPGFYTRSTDVTGEGVGKRGQVGPLKGSLNEQRKTQGKAPLGKSQEADAVNDLILQYRFPERFNQIEARDNGGVELPRRAGAVDPRRPDLGPRKKTAADAKSKDNIVGGRKINQTKIEEAKRLAERERVARSRAAAANRGPDDGGVNWSARPTGTQRSLPILDDRLEQLAQAAAKQEEHQIAFARLIDRYSVLNPEAGDLWRLRGSPGPGGQLTRPTLNDSIGFDRPSNRTDRVTDPRSTTRGKAGERELARARALGLEPEIDKNAGGKKGHTTNWERPNVKTAGLPANKATAEPIAKRLEQRDVARTETPNINRNAGAYRIPDLIEKVKKDPKLTAAQKSEAIKRLTRILERGQGTTPSRGGTRPGSGGTTAPRNQNPPLDREGTAAQRKAANKSALEAQEAGDRQHEFLPGGELRGVQAISDTRRLGVNKTKVTGREPAAEARTAQAEQQLRQNRKQNASIARGPRTNSDGTLNQSDVNYLNKLRENMAKQEAEMLRIREARARRRSGR